MAATPCAGPRVHFLVGAAQLNPPAPNSPPKMAGPHWRRLHFQHMGQEDELKGLDVTCGPALHIRQHPERPTGSLSPHSHTAGPPPTTKAHTRTQSP